jgi:hypothetical protein
MSLRKYGEDCKSKDIYLYEYEKYEKDLDFIAMIARDCKAWVEFYEKEVKFLQEEVEWKSDRLKADEQRVMGDFETMRHVQIEAELERALDSVIYSNQQIKYWQKMADKWTEELKRETGNFKS